jgi:uncharacterized protein YjbI with pentapeptide repeats
MADDEHVALLRQGVATWNKWRGEHLNIRPDLREANLWEANLGGANLTRADLSGAILIKGNLSEANLAGVDLSNANLMRADLNEANLGGANLSGAHLDWAYLWEAQLSGANLSGAHLREANLRQANLWGANLSGARLWEANLTEANLIEANLSGAHLSRANLVNANVRGANLTGAALSWTVFGDVDLTGVIGLETCEHRRPSIIDHRTLERSGRLPLSFLRGVGLPDNLIEPSLYQALHHYSCFISYSTKDQEFAERLYADLQNKGVRCWFAPHDLRIGDKILDEIDAAIRFRDKVLLILSKHSIKSDWVEDEVTAGFEEERKRGHVVLFPVRLDEAVMKTNEAWAAKLRARLIGDFQHWKDHDAYKRSFEHVVRDLTKSTRAEQRRSKNESPGRATTYV